MIHPAGGHALGVCCEAQSQALPREIDLYDFIVFF